MYNAEIDSNGEITLNNVYPQSNQKQGNDKYNKCKIITNADIQTIKKNKSKANKLKSRFINVDNNNRIIDIMDYVDGYIFVKVDNKFVDIRTFEQLSDVPFDIKSNYHFLSEVESIKVCGNDIRLSFKYYDKKIFVNKLFVAPSFRNYIKDYKLIVKKSLFGMVERVVPGVYYNQNVHHEINTTIYNCGLIVDDSIPLIVAQGDAS